MAINFGLQNYRRIGHLLALEDLWGQYVICIPEKNMIVVRLGRKFGVIER